MSLLEPKAGSILPAVVARTSKLASHRETFVANVRLSGGVSNLPPFGDASVFVLLRQPPETTTATGPFRSFASNLSASVAPISAGCETMLYGAGTVTVDASAEALPAGLRKTTVTLASLATAGRSAT